MKRVLAHLATLPPDEREAFAVRCGTTVGYMRKLASTNQRVGEKIAIAIDRESKGAVTVEQLRPDVDWAYLRGTNSEQKTASTLDGQAVSAPETVNGKNATKDAPHA